MSTDAPPLVAPTDRASRTWWALRVVATAHAVAIAVQPVLAGMLLSGNYTALQLHALGADVASYLGLGQLVVALVVWFRMRVWWPTAVAALIVLGETGQYFAGLDGALDLHVPLGVALVVGTAGFVIALWRPVR